MWVYNGVRLLRDEGIPRNPRSIILYKQLGWIFFSKMGETMDEMHMVYKQRWARQMQELLAAPPYDKAGEVSAVSAGGAAVLTSPAHALSAGEYVTLAGFGTTPDINGSQSVSSVVDANHFTIAVDVTRVTDGAGTWTRDATDAFRPIAEAPLDKDTQPDRDHVIQAAQRDKLLRDADVAAYAALLAAQGVKIDEGLLIAYNAYTRSDDVEVTRVVPPRPETEKDQAMSRLINAPQHALARNRLLAFIRAQILWNHYRMDPQWMLGMMDRYGPIDWRVVDAHGLYWLTYGMHVCESLSRDDIDAINLDRIILNCLKSMTWNGRMTYVENPTNPDAPYIRMFSDWRFIDATQAEHDRLIQAIIKTRKQEYKENILKDGHINYLASAIQMLYAGHRRQKAQELYDWVKKHYDLKVFEWKLPLDDFVFWRLNTDGKPIPEIAFNQMTAALQMAFFFLSRNEMDAYRDSFNYARRVYTKYMEDSPDRLKMPPFAIMVANVAADMLVMPRSVGFNLPLESRIRLYASLDPDIQVLLYDPVRPFLARECRSYGLDFREAFPPPPGLREYRDGQRQQFTPLAP